MDGVWASLCEEGAAQVRYHADKSGLSGKQESDEAMQVHRAATRCNESDGDYQETEITKGNAPHPKQASCLRPLNNTCELPIIILYIGTLAV